MAGYARAHWRKAAPAADLAARVSAASERVAGLTGVRKQSRRLASIVAGAASYAQRPDPAAVVVEAWKRARVDGRTAEETRALTMSVLAQRYGQAQVRDVAPLPRPAHTRYTGQCCPAEWTDEELQHLWREWAAGWIDELEQAYDRVRTGPEYDPAEEGGTRRLMLLTGWRGEPEDRLVQKRGQHKH
jgi:hypothetical protein